MPTKAAKIRRLSAAERRDLILEGAMQVFAEHGYNDASMAQIARSAGITPAVIYDHFASKQELHEVLLETHTDALLTFVGQSVLAFDGDPARRLRTGIDAFFVFVETHPFAWRLIFRDAPSDPVIAEAHDRVSHRATEAIAVLIGYSAPASFERLANREQVLEMYGQMLKMSLNGLASWWYEHRDVPREEVVERMMDFCWTGLERLATSDGEEGG